MIGQSSRFRSVIIIPARVGSKRIPRKNIKLFAGKPMIAHSILAAQASGVADRIVVSTESEEIADVARQWGAEVPFMRPLELADDYTATSPVILHALDELEKQGCTANLVCCLYATAPFVQPRYLRDGYELVKNGPALSAYTVARYPFPIWRAVRVNAGGFLESVWPEHRLTRSQDLPEVYQDAGQFYWSQVPAYRETQRFMSPACAPIVLPRYLVQDIDTPEDWESAEIMFEVLRNRHVDKNEGIGT